MTQDLSPAAREYAGLASELSNAPEVPDRAALPDLDPAPDTSGGGAGGVDRDRPHGEIYDGCPVIPLGVRGDFIYALDANGQMRSVKKLDAGTIQSLFGHTNNQLTHHYPVWQNQAEKGDPPNWQRKPKTFVSTDVTHDLYAAASECGVFNPDNAVRGVGAWVDDDARLIYHAGDKVYHRGEWLAPGRIDGRIYPAFPKIPKPDNTADAPDPIPPLMDTLQTWSWTEPDTHPFIALGMIATQMLCGALDWRPVFWLLAPAGSGKSELQKLVKMLHGDDGLVQTTDTTKSGITSKLGQSSLPVSVDELEPGDERSTKERDIIALARVAASGGEWFRGSSDQTGVGGKIYSAFLFSSILIPGVMKTQDVQRLIRMELGPLPKDAPKLSLQPRVWRARGARMKALLFSRWDTWADRHAMWRHALELADVRGRDADNWSVVLAMADMAMTEDLPTAGYMEAWAKKIAFIAMADREETSNDAEAMLLHLMGQNYDPFRRGEQFNVAQWVMAAASLPGAPEGIPTNDTISAHEKRKRVNVILAKSGLRVLGTGEDAELFIANKSIPGLNDLFRGSEWHGGVWKQSAARVPGARASESSLTLAGLGSRGWYVPIKAIAGLSSFPLDHARAPAKSNFAEGDENDPANWG